MDSQQKATKFNDIIGMWEQNERDRENGKTTGKEDDTTKEEPPGNDLDQVIKQEDTQNDEKQ